MITIHYSAVFGNWNIGPELDYNYADYKESQPLKGREDNSEAVESEIQSLQAEYDHISREQAMTATELAYAGVISYNKKNLPREIQNESRQKKRGRSTRMNLKNN